MLISNRYVMAPVGPERTALTTRRAGRVPVWALVSGAMGTGALMMTAGPTVNLNVAPYTPVVPAPCARACQ